MQRLSTLRPTLRPTLMRLGPSRSRSQRSFSSLYPVPRRWTDGLVAVFSDAQLDRAHEFEKQRLDSFHGIAGAMDRPSTAAAALDVREIISSVDAEMEIQVLRVVAAEARRRRAEIQDVIRQRVQDTLDDLMVLDEDSEFEYEYVEVDEAGGGGADDEDLDVLNGQVLRLLLLEQCCSAMEHAMMPLEAALPEFGPSADGERGATVLASFYDAVTALRQSHGVIVSVPGLLNRVGLSEMGRRKLVEQDGAGGDGAGAHTPGSVIDRERLAACLNACLTGGYDDRLSTHLEFFRSLRGGNDVDQGSLRWQEVEVVLRFLGEYSALALREALLAYETVSKKDSSAEATVDGDASDAPTTASASSSDPSDASSTKSPDESGKSSSQLQQNELLYSTRDAGAVDVDKAVELAMRQKAVADYQATQQSADALKAATEAAREGDSGGGGDGEPIVLRYAAEGAHAKEEKRWVTRHTKVWLLHDFDHMQVNTTTSTQQFKQTPLRKGKERKGTNCQRAGGGPHECRPTFPNIGILNCPLSPEMALLFCVGREERSQDRHKEPL